MNIEKIEDKLSSYIPYKKESKNFRNKNLTFETLS